MRNRVAYTQAHSAEGYV